MDAEVEQLRRGCGPDASAVTPDRVVFLLDTGNAVTDNAIAIKSTSRGATTL
jgi:hypothetical protein